MAGMAESAVEVNEVEVYRIYSDDLKLKVSGRTSFKQGQSRLNPFLE